MNTPTCFISYSWEPKGNKSWVRKLASDLQHQGVHVHLDQWDLRPGADLTNYMESSIRDSQFVLLVCTPSFSRKANKGEGGVGYEKRIVTGEIFSDVSDETKFVPVLRNGNAKESLPSYLKSRLFVDFREEEMYASSLEQLLRHFFGSPEFERPPIGKKPILETKSNNIATLENKEQIQRHNANEGNFDLSKFKELVKYASMSTTYGGLGYSTDDAVAWAYQKK